MNRPRLTALTILIFIWLLALGRPQTVRATVPEPGQELTLLYSNDVNGETEPCG